MKKLNLVFLATLFIIIGCDNPVTPDISNNVTKNHIYITVWDSTEYLYEYDSIDYYKSINTLIIYNNGDTLIFPSFNSKILKFNVRR